MRDTQAFVYLHNLVLRGFFFKQFLLISEIFQGCKVFSFTLLLLCLPFISFYSSTSFVIEYVHVCVQHSFVLITYVL